MVGARWLLTLVALSAFACQAQKFGTDPSKSDALWVAPGPAYGQPAADNTTIYFGTTDHRVIAADRKTGSIRWQARTDSVSVRTEFGLNVILSSGLVVFGDYYIYAFDQATGARKWVFNPERQGIPGYAAGAYEISSDAGVIYAGSGSGHAYAINAQDGSLRWVASLGADGNTSVYNPVLDAQTVYVIVRHFTNPITGAVVALDRQTGTVLWSYSFSPLTPQTGSDPVRVVLFGNFVIASVSDGKIYAIDKTTHAETWVAPRLADVQGLEDTRPIILAGALVVAGSTALELTGYDASTGRQVWQVNGGQGSSSNPLATDGTVVYVPFFNGILGAFDASSGGQHWLRSAPNKGSFAPSPVIGSDGIFAPSSIGLVALPK
jgi:outer membrane protein assembly factor BamB